MLSKLCLGRAFLFICSFYYNITGDGIMTEQIVTTTTENLTDQQKAVSLFSYIRELNKLKQKAILNLSEYSWARTLSSFPNDPENISVFYRDRVAAEDTASTGNILLVCHLRTSKNFNFKINYTKPVIQGRLYYELSTYC